MPELGGFAAVGAGPAQTVAGGGLEAETPVTGEVTVRECLERTQSGGRCQMLMCVFGGLLSSALVSSAM